MIDLAILAAGLLTGAAGAVARRGLRRRAKRTVIVHTRDGQSIRGVLLDSNRKHLVLAQPEYVAGVRPVGIAGHVFVPAANYSWHQEIPVTALAASGTEPGERAAAVS